MACYEGKTQAVSSPNSLLPLQKSWSIRGLVQTHIRSGPPATRRVDRKVCHQTLRDMDVAVRRARPVVVPASVGGRRAGGRRGGAGGGRARAGEALRLALRALRVPHELESGGRVDHRLPATLPGHSCSSLQLNTMGHNHPSGRGLGSLLKSIPFMTPKTPPKIYKAGAPLNFLTVTTTRKCFEPPPLPGGSSRLAEKRVLAGPLPFLFRGCLCDRLASTKWGGGLS